MQVGSRTLVCNPESGSGDHADLVPRLARGKGFAVWETERPGDGRRLGRRAAEEDVSELAVCGGDGTVNEVLRGLEDGNHLDRVTLSVVPAGTANLLAGNVGIRDLRHGLEVADRGEIRSIDVGMAGGEPFIVSCIAGLPADASTSASTELKRRFGTLAFVVTGIQEALEFEGIQLELEARSKDAVGSWSGEALSVLVGNARKFLAEGGQANMEDGLFDVAVIEQRPPPDLVAEAVTHRVLGRTGSVEHYQAAQVEVTADHQITFSRDGELSEHDSVLLYNRPCTLDLRVGPEYDPEPAPVGSG